MENLLGLRYCKKTGYVVVSGRADEAANLGQRIWICHSSYEPYVTQKFKTAHSVIEAFNILQEFGAEIVFKVEELG